MPARRGVYGQVACAPVGVFYSCGVHDDFPAGVRILVLELRVRRPGTDGRLRCDGHRDDAGGVRAGVLGAAAQQRHSRQGDRAGLLRPGGCHEPVRGGEPVRCAHGRSPGRRPGVAAAAAQARGRVHIRGRQPRERAARAEERRGPPGHGRDRRDPGTVPGTDAGYKPARQRAGGGRRGAEELGGARSSAGRAGRWAGVRPVVGLRRPAGSAGRATRGAGRRGDRPPGPRDR